MFRLTLTIIMRLFYNMEVNNLESLDIVKIAANALNDKKAREISAVKIADLTHNMDLSRFENPTKWDYDRVEYKYKPAMEILKK